MTTPATETDLLFPLSTFEGVLGQRATAAVAIPPDDVPPPYHELLVHERDMTGTLEAHFGQPMVLRVLQKRVEDDLLFRQVLLQGQRDGRTAEFGAIRIDLSCFDGEARQRVEDSRQPLGGILRAFDLPYTSKPSAYLSVDADAFVREALGAGSTTALFGRRNTLTDADGRTMARIIEVLPPLAPKPASNG